MKKIIKLIGTIFLFLIVLGVIGSIFGGNDSENKPSSSGLNNVPSQNERETSKKEEEPEVQIEYEEVSLSEMMDLLDENALKAKDTYQDKYVEVSGKLSVIDASGKYISLVRADKEYSIIGIHCTVKSDEQRAQIAEMSIDDSVTLRGKITDVGEVAGYYLNIDSIDGYDITDAADLNVVDGYIVVTADQLVDEVNDNALRAKNTYNNQMISVTGAFSTIDSDGKYINIEPRNNPYSFTIIQCYIKSDDIKQIVMDLKKGEIITVKGKCTDVGEVLGYSITIESIEK